MAANSPVSFKCGKSALSLGRRSMRGRPNGEAFSGFQTSHATEQARWRAGCGMMDIWLPNLATIRTRRKACNAFHLESEAFHLACRGGSTFGHQIRSQRMKAFHLACPSGSECGPSPPRQLAAPYFNSLAKQIHYTRSLRPAAFLSD